MFSSICQGDDEHKPPFFIIATNVDGEAYGDQFGSLEERRSSQYVCYAIFFQTCCADKDARDNIEEYNLPLVIVDSPSGGKMGW